MKKILFYDLEFATSRYGINKICEFGYVLVNEKFEILEKGNFIINPNIRKAEWDRTVVKKILTRKIREYESSLTFDKFYNKIKELIISSDYIIGHSLNGDANGLNQECERYNLESIDYDFYEIKNFYKYFSENKNYTSLEKMLIELQILGDERAHDAGADAFNTMLILKEVLLKQNLTLDSLIKLVPEAKDRSENYKLASARNKKENNFKQIEKFIETDGKVNEFKKPDKVNKSYHKYLHNLTPNKEVGERLKNCVVSVGLNYEKEQPKQLSKLAQIITNEGGKICFKSSESNLFIKYDVLGDDGTVIDDVRLICVQNENKKGKSIQIITLEDFLKIINITMEELEAMPIPKVCILNNKTTQKKVKKTVTINPNKLVYSENKPSLTLGDLLSEILLKKGT